MNGWMTRASAAVLCATALAGCSETSPDLSLSAEDELLEDIMETYFSERFRVYPVESTLAGLPGGDDRIGDFSRAAIEARIGWLIDFHHKLLGLRLTSLSQPGYLDALWMTSLVKAELFQLEERALWRRSARFYADPARVGLVALIAEGELTSRTDALAGRLREIPGLLDSARENLEPAHRVFLDDGRASLDAIRRLLDDLPEILGDRVPPHELAELAELSRSATRAVQESIAALPALQSGGDPLDFTLGEEAFARFVLYEHMVDWSLDKIAVEAEEELAAVRYELSELALARFASQSLPAVLAPKPTSQSVEETIIDAESRIVDFIRERHGLNPEEVSFPVRRVPRYFPGDDVLELWRPKALEPSRGAFLMVRDVTRVDASALELLTVREVGGRARQFAAQAASTSLLRRVVAAPTTAAGWMSRFERDVLDDGFDADNDALRVEHYQRALLDLVRLLAAVGVHAHGSSMEQAATLFREHALLSVPAARAEAERVALDPGVGDAGLGRLLLNELARDYRRAFPVSDGSELQELVLADGLLPIRLLRFRLLESPL